MRVKSRHFVFRVDARGPMPTAGTLAAAMRVRHSGVGLATLPATLVTA